MSQKWVTPAELTPSGRPVLNNGEVECFIISSVDIEPDNHFSPLKSGLLTLTTHRLLWIPSTSTSTSRNDAVFIPLSVISFIHPPHKSIKSLLSISSPRFKFDLLPSNSGVRAVTVVMRGKADNHDLFYEKLWAAWKARAWEVAGESNDDGGERGSDSRVGSVAIRMPVVGVSGILRKEQELWESTDKSLQDAFQDLNALMSKAREMVMLAEKMRQKLLAGQNNQSSTANDDEMGSKEEIQELLLSVGIISPVTKESAGALYHQQLSRQLADFVKIPLERAGGMINLIDIYCLFNRARGTGWF